MKRALVAVPDQAGSTGTPRGVRRESRPACPAKPGGDDLSPAASALAERHTERARVQRLIGQELPDVDLERSADLCRDSDTAIERYVAYYFYPGSRVPGTGRESPAADRAQHRAFAVYAAQLATKHVRVVGVSTENPNEMYATRNAHWVSHDLCSDPQLELAHALGLPTFYDAALEQRYRRLLLLSKARTIEWVSYPVDDPAAGPRQILTWLNFNT